MAQSPRSTPENAAIGTRSPVVESVLELPDLAATEALGRRLAAVLGPGDVVALVAPLGGGKTALARAVIQARAGAAIEVPSPSFTLVQDYHLPGLTIRHIDLYRITSPDELLELGLDTPAADEAWLVEWPDRAGRHLPPDRLEVFMTERRGPTAGDGTSAAPEVVTGRRVRLVAGPAWRGRLDLLLQR